MRKEEVIQKKKKEKKPSLSFQARVSFYTGSLLLGGVSLRHQCTQNAFGEINLIPVTCRSKSGFTTGSGKPIEDVVWAAEHD